MKEVIKDSNRANWLWAVSTADWEIYSIEIDASWVMLIENPPIWWTTANANPKIISDDNRVPVCFWEDSSDSTKFIPIQISPEGALLWET